MKINKLFPLVLLIAIALPVHAATIINPGFEDGWQGWTEIDKDGKSASISKDANSGEKSAKLTSQAGTFAQVIQVKPQTSYELSAYVLRSGILGVKIGDAVVFERQGKTRKWKKLSVEFNSGDATSVAIFTQYNGNKKSLFDDFEIREISGKVTTASESIRLAAGGLSPDLPPSQNFELIDWYLHIPADDDRDGRGDNIYEAELVKGYQHKDYFYTGKDGGMVMRATVAGKKTSENTKYTRTELREMLRRGDKSIRTKSEANTTNKNNWVFSTAPERAQKASGGVDGVLKATLAVNHVTTTGEAYQIGRVIIGQIHAKHDEPVRLYYRKLPGNEKGSIYAAHQPAGGKDQWFEILGSRSNSAENPADGIALNEKFSYRIIAKGHRLDVIISQEDKQLGSATIDMSESGFDVADEYMYFKAGVYNQNNSGDPQDYVQATFYELENKHDGYPY